MYGSITDTAISAPGYKGWPLVVAGSNVGLARSWSVIRTPRGFPRWQWSASGPKGSRRGYAHSRAVADVRAKRAYEELA